MKNYKGENCGNPWKAIHGHSPKGDRSPTYKTWASMHSRCKDKSNTNYFGKGIHVCDRWNEFSNFLEDMGERPENCTIDRINPDGNYDPENCRWATSADQSRNKSGSIIVEFNGINLNLKDLADQFGIPTTTIYRRYHQGVRGADLVSKKNRLKLRVGSKASNSKLSEKDVIEIKKLLLEGLSSQKIADKFGVSQPTISNIKTGATWSHLK